MMKASDLREKTSDELKEALIGELKQQFSLRMKLSTGQLNESYLVMQTRKNIARIKTVLNQKAGE